MGRNAIPLAYIPEKRRRITTANKRTDGLESKAAQLSILSGSDVMLIAYNKNDPGIRPKVFISNKEELEFSNPSQPAHQAYIQEFEKFKMDVLTQGSSYFEDQKHNFRENLNAQSCKTVQERMLFPKKTISKQRRHKNNTVDLSQMIVSADLADFPIDLRSDIPADLPEVRLENNTSDDIQSALSGNTHLPIRKRLKTLARPPAAKARGKKKAPARRQIKENPLGD